MPAISTKLTFALGSDEKSRKLPSKIVVSQSQNEKLDHVLLKALRRSPEDRYQSVKEFSEAIALARQYIPLRLVASGAHGFLDWGMRLFMRQAYAPNAMASRVAVRRRTSIVNAILFVAATLTTAILVAILVTIVRRKMGVP